MKRGKIMIKRISCFLLGVVLIFVWCLNVYAVTATADLISNNSTVKAGDIFTVTLSINCVDGINGATGITYNYDANVLELVNSGVNDTNFMNIGNTSTIDLISNSSTKITTSNIYKFTFKVKEDATPGATTQITMNNFSIDSDAQTDSESTIGAKSITITVASNESSEQKNGDKEKENGETPNTEDKQSETPTVSKEDSKTTEVKTSEEEPEITEIKTSEETKKQNETSTFSNKKLPKTGSIRGIGYLIGLIIVIVLYSFIKYRRINI